MELIYLSVGVGLAFLSSWVIEGLKTKKIRGEKTANLRLILKQEIASVLKWTDRLQIVFETRNYFELTTIEQIEKSITNLENQKGNTIHLNSAELQKDFIELVSKMSFFMVGIRILETNYLDALRENGEKYNKESIEALKVELEKRTKETINYYQSNRVIKIIELSEIQMKAETFLKSI